MIYNRCLLCFGYQHVYTVQRPLVVWLQGETGYNVVLLYIDHRMVFYEVPRHTDKSNGAEKHIAMATLSQTSISYNQHD